MPLNKKEWKKIAKGLKEGKYLIYGKDWYVISKKEIKKKYNQVYKTLKGMLKTEEEIFNWLAEPNPEYENMSPLELLSQGHIDTIMNYLEDIKKGSLT